MTALLLWVLAACPDRACLVDAAKTCTPNTGTLDVADWFALSGGKVKGTTAVVVEKGPGHEKCTVKLTAKVTEAPDGRAARITADVRSALICEGLPAPMARLLEVLGTDAIKPIDLMACYATKCDPLPPLAKGCKAGPCARGNYAVTCGKNVCQLLGVPKDEVPPNLAYGCGEGGALEMKPKK
jgi:hypothetical protein